MTQELRKNAAALAAKHNKLLIILETQCPKDVSLQRISKRTKEKYQNWRTHNMGSPASWITPHVWYSYFAWDKVEKRDLEVAQIWHKLEIKSLYN